MRLYIFYSCDIKSCDAPLCDYLSRRRPFCEWHGPFPFMITWDAAEILNLEDYVINIGQGYASYFRIRLDGVT